jgi:ribonuclease BN (tRNA processing enzyme)
MNRHVSILLLALLSVPLNHSSASAQSCTGNPVAIQILGSGGPYINPSRSSSSYLLWIGDQAKILVDMGGGAHHRFGEAQAKVRDLSLVAISHLHPDHVADLPALIWISNRFREEPLPIVGPSGNNVFPDFSTFLYRLFDEKTGAFQVLGSALGGKESYAASSVRLDVGVVDVTKAEPSAVYDRAGVTVTALGIPHGDSPTLAYRVQTRGVSVVFSSDQTGTSPEFVKFAKGANVLIMHLAIPVGERNPFHATPDVVGRIAQEAGIGRLIVSHLTPLDLDAAIDELRKFYTGPLTIGADLQCTPVQ